MTDPVAMLYAMQERIDRLENELAMRPLEGGGGSKSYLYRIVHGQPTGTLSQDGVKSLVTEPTECAAAFETYTKAEVINDDTTLPDGFGIVQKLDGGLFWFVNYNDGLQYDLLDGATILCVTSLTLPIAGTSPEQTIRFLLPQGITVT